MTFTLHQIRSSAALWWLGSAALIGVFVIVAQSWTAQGRPGGAGQGPADELAVVEPEADPSASDPHEPVHIRLGVITELGEDYLLLDTAKLKGKGRELLRVNMNADTKILEIQIPSYLNAELQELLADGGDVIPRQEVGRSQLYVGQTVEVVSVTDMYGLRELSATRVEYKVVVNTEGATP